MKKLTHAETVMKLARQKSVLRPRDLNALGIPRVVLSRLCRRGLLVRTGRGLYVPADVSPSENHSLAEAQKKIPRGVVCLLSALRFHNLTTQAPFEVWMAIDPKARKPIFDHPPVRIVRFSSRSLKFGVEEHRVQGVTIQVTSPAKTVADCFRYRNKIGLDVAIEALRDYRRNKAGTMDDLWRAAEVCRVVKVLRPYMDAIV